MIKAELTNQKRGAAIFRNRKGALRGGKRERGREGGGGELGEARSFFFLFLQAQVARNSFRGGLHRTEQRGKHEAKRFFQYGRPLR